MKGLCELNRVKSNKIYTDVTVNSHNMQTTEENFLFLHDKEDIIFAGLCCRSHLTKHSFVLALIWFLMMVIPACRNRQIWKHGRKNTNREMALVMLWKVSVEILRGNELQHGVPQKLQSLVMAPATSYCCLATTAQCFDRMQHPHIRVFYFTQNTYRDNTTKLHKSSHL